jgi:tetratricopeptide (TPR) repeat protein
MCVAPTTTEFEAAVRAMQQHTAEIKVGGATALIYFQRGSALQQLRALDAALKDYASALSFDPPLDEKSQAALQDNRNTCLRQLSRYDEAIAAGMEAIRLHPDNARYHTNLGFVRYWSGDYEAALSNLERALELEPNEWWAYGYRGMIYAMIGKSENAVDDFTIVIDTGGAMALLYLWRAQAHFQSGAFESAEADATIAIDTTDRDDYRMWAQRGWARLNQGKLVEALGDFNESIAMHSDGYTYLGRALVYRALDAQHAAEIEMQKFVNLHPQGALAALQEFAYYVEKNSKVLV